MQALKYVNEQWVLPGYPQFLTPRDADTAEVLDSAFEFLADRRRFVEQVLMLPNPTSSLVPSFALIYREG